MGENKNKVGLDADLAAKLEQMSDEAEKKAAAEADKPEEKTDISPETKKNVKPAGPEPTADTPEEKKTEKQAAESNASKPEKVGLDDKLAAAIEEKSDDAEPEKKKVGLNDKLAAAVEKTSDDAEKADEEKPKKKGKAGKIIGIILLCLLGAALIAGAIYYFNQVNLYKAVYYPTTRINGIDASYRTPEQVREILANQSEDFSMTFKSRFRDDAVITAQDVGLHYTTDNAPVEILLAQNPYLWFVEMRKPHDHKITSMAEVDEEKFNAFCDSLPAFDDSTVTPSVDARLGDYNSLSKQYEIIPEINGNQIQDKEGVKALLKEAILTLQPELNIDTEEYDFYPTAKVTSEDEKLHAEMDKLNRFVKTRIVFRDADKVLDGDTIDKMLIKAPDGTLSIDQEKLQKYVEDYAAEVNTVGITRSFITHDGRRATVEGGTYGNKLDEKAEFEALLALCESGGEVIHDPVLSQRAASITEPDYGNSYVEVSIEEQHVWFFKDGKLIMDTDCVTGLASSKARYTPDGTYFIYYKQLDRILRGERHEDGSYDYESHVNYWMPFNKGIGLHDATWRGSFGGEIYKYSGSHGCVNLPYKFAKELYPQVEVGFPVIVYSSAVRDFSIKEKPEDQTLPAEEPETTAAPKAETKKAAEPAKKNNPAPAPAPALVETQPETLPAAPPQEVAIPYEPEAVAPVEGVHGGPGVSPVQ